MSINEKSGGIWNTVFMVSQNTNLAVTWRNWGKPWKATFTVTGFPGNT